MQRPMVHKHLRLYPFNLHKTIYHSKKISATYEKWTQAFKQSTLYSCQILTKHEFPRQIFDKYCNINFHQNASTGS